MKKTQFYQTLLRLAEKWIGQAKQANDEGFEIASLVLAVLMNLVWSTKFSREHAEDLSVGLKALREKHANVLSRMWGERGDLLAKALESLK